MEGRSEDALCWRVGMLRDPRGRSEHPSLSVKEKSGFLVRVLMLFLLRKLGDPGLATDPCRKVAGTECHARGTVSSC